MLRRFGIIACWGASGSRTRPTSCPASPPCTSCTPLAPITSLSARSRSWRKKPRKRLLWWKNDNQPIWTEGQLAPDPSIRRVLSTLRATSPPSWNVRIVEHPNHQFWLKKGVSRNGWQKTIRWVATRLFSYLNTTSMTVKQKSGRRRSRTKTVPRVTMKAQANSTSIKVSFKEPKRMVLIKRFSAPKVRWTKQEALPPCTVRTGIALIQSVLGKVSLSGWSRTRWVITWVTMCKTTFHPSGPTASSNRPTKSSSRTVMSNRCWTI